MEQVEKSYDEVDTVWEFIYLDDVVISCGGCEAAGTSRLVIFRECGELLHGERFPLRLNGAVYESYVWPTILYGSEA